MKISTIREINLNTNNRIKLCRYRELFRVLSISFIQPCSFYLTGIKSHDIYKNINDFKNNGNEYLAVKIRTNGLYCLLIYFICLSCWVRYMPCWTPLKIRNVAFIGYPDFTSTSLFRYSSHYYTYFKRPVQVRVLKE